LTPCSGRERGLQYVLKSKFASSSVLYAISASGTLQTHFSHRVAPSPWSRKNFPQLAQRFMDRTTVMGPLASAYAESP
jgi:hypothetical protein